MGQPASRITDMHVCPMSTGPVPHVGGPISGPCAPTVLIGGLLAARVTDMCVCVGPPDVIVKGSGTVITMAPLTIDMQNAMFAELADIIAARTEAAREAGTLDIGVETILAQRLAILERRAIHTDARSGAVSELLTIERGDRRWKRSADQALGEEAPRLALLIHDKTGEPAILRRAQSLMDEEGVMHQRVKLVTPEGSRIVFRDLFDSQAGWREAEEPAFAARWDAATEALPDLVISRFHMATGALLPIWKHLPGGGQAKIWRAMLDDGSSALGRVLGEDEARALRAALDPSDVTDAATLIAALTEENRRIPLAQGAALALRRIGMRMRLEIETPPVDHLPALKAAGCFVEMIAWRARLFVPFDEADPKAAIPALEKVLAILPLAGAALHENGNRRAA